MSSRIARFRRVGTTGFLCVLLATVSACNRGDGIREYTVKRVESTTPTSPPPAVPSGNIAWFLKLTGPVDRVKELLEPFSRVLESFVLQPDGRPTFDTPAGWTLSDGPPPRYQTLTISGSNPPLELTISPLPMTSIDLDSYLLANINRWRGQLELAAMEGSDWKQQAEAQGEFRSIPGTGRSVAMVHLTGKTKEFGESRMLGAVIVPNADRKEPTASRSPSESGPLNFQLPEGWTVSAGNTMRLGSFQAGAADAPVDVSVTRFPGGGDILSNINRWRGQVKLDPIDEEQLADSVERLTIDGREATYAELIGEEIGILAAILEDGDAKWFFKAQGPKATIDAERTRFRDFLHTVKLKAP